MAGEHPHVLILTSDEHAPQVTGCMGDPLVRTPNIDRLASRGVLFENAYCNNPICVPGRYSIMTGKYVRDLGALHYGDGLDPKTWTYPKHFARAGYQTTCVGKMHFMGLEQMHGWMFRPYGDMELVHGHSKMPGFSKDPYAETPGRGRSLTEWIRCAGPGTGGFIMFDESVTREARIHLTDYFRQTIYPIYSPERPLLFQVSWKTPHWPFWAPEELYNHYRPIMTTPEIPAPPREEEHPHMQHKHSWEKPEEPTESEILSARAAYWGLVEYTDRQIGLVLDVLEELGVLDEFLIIYHSDHGEMAGNHGSWGKGCMYEHSVRVPFVVSWPGHVPEGARVAANVSLVDMFPTVADYAGLDIPTGLRGGSLRPLIEGGTGAEGFAGRAVISEFHTPGRPSCVMAKLGDIKLVTYEGKFPDRLFDLSDDPRELVNRAGDPAYAEVQGALKAEIDALPEPFKWDENARYATPDDLP